MTKVTIALPDDLIRDLKLTSERGKQDTEEIIVKILKQYYSIEGN